MSQPTPTISEIQSLIDNLPVAPRSLCQRIFSVSTTTGRLVPPAPLIPWIKELFGSVDRVTEQKIVKITNLITFEGSIFNTLRGVWPKHIQELCNAETIPAGQSQQDLFANPDVSTTEDIFGRVRGKYAVTASNIAKFDGFHSMVIFKTADRLEFSEREVVDYIDTGWRWAQEAHRYDPSAKYFSLLWNSGKRAGASQLHGHAHVALGKDMHYTKVEALRRAALQYKSSYGTNYFDDLYEVHRALGLALEKEDIRIITSLTPIKEKETIVLSAGLTDSFKRSVYRVLACFRDMMQVASFNVGIATPPLDTVQEDWTGFPVIAHIVDRGPSSNESSDFGAVELFAANVAYSDPFRVAQLIRDALIPK